jgi:hypothetical protein
MKARLLILMLAGLVSCRSVLRTSGRADSSSVRSEQASEQFTREIIREYLPGRTDTVLNNQIIQVPQLQPINVPYPVYRETIRETGQKQQSKTEEKTAEVKENTIEKKPLSPWIFLGIGAGVVIAMVILFCVFYLLIKAR